MENNDMGFNGAAPFLTEEIITNILTWLPVKTLKRFQCVCKQWNNLIKTPSFIQQHLHRSTHHNSSLLMGPEYSNDTYFLLSFNRDLKFRDFENVPMMGSFDGLCMVGSSNGLLCLIDWNQQPATFLLWNPATREVRRIPIICTAAKYPGINWRFGFGYCPISNDYKIVRLSYVGDISQSYVGEVFSTSTGCWRYIDCRNIRDIYITTYFWRNNHVVAANGALFWHALNENGTPVILSCDLALEVLTVLPMPDFASHFAKLAVCDDKLAIITYPKAMRLRNSYRGMVENGNSIYFAVLEEETDGSCGKRWSSSKKYSGNFDVIISDGTIWRNKIVVIDFRTSIDAEHGVEDNESLYLIDVNVDECQQFVLPTPRSSEGVRVFNYVESLVPLRGNIQIEEP